MHADNMSSMEVFYIPTIAYLINEWKDILDSWQEMAMAWGLLMAIGG